METKICSKCKSEKDINEFHKKSDSKDGHYPFCKKCSIVLRKKYYVENKEICKQKMKEYYKNNKEKIREKNKEWYFNHKEEIKLYNKKYNKEHENELKKYRENRYKNNKKTILEKQQEYYQKHKDEINEKRKDYFEKYREKYNKEHKEELRIKKRIYKQMNKDKTREQSKRHYYNVIKNDKLLLFKKRIRGLIRTSLDRKKQIKNNHTEEILGCDIESFISHLIKTYENNYNERWENKYLEKVHIDHIIPLSTAKTEEEVIKLCHYTNLQLLKSEDNLKKSNNVEWSLKNE